MYLIQLMFVLASSLFIVESAQAKKIHFNRLKSFYSESIEIKERKCQNCHSSKGLQLNPFGQDFGKLLNDFETMEEVFLALEELDSDEDGSINLDEIVNGTNPAKASFNLSSFVY